MLINMEFVVYQHGDYRTGRNGVGLSVYPCPQVHTGRQNRNDVLRLAAVTDLKGQISDVKLEMGQ